jgi:opacity protein-like surface antigen
MKRILLILAICASCAAVANAQSYGNDIKQVFSINYQANVPVGSSTNFISNMSFEGFNINWTYFLTGNFAVGMDLSYNNYHENIGQKVYRPNPNTAINAAQYRYTQVFPIKAQAKYFFTPNYPVKVYAGLGVGALSAGEHIVIQDYDAWNNNWAFIRDCAVDAVVETKLKDIDMKEQKNVFKTDKNKKSYDYTVTLECSKNDCTWDVDIKGSMTVENLLNGWKVTKITVANSEEVRGEIQR